MKTKVCTRCRQEKPLVPKFFHRASDTRDGFGGQCSACKREVKKQARRSASVDTEFPYGAVWEFTEEGRTLAITVLSTGVDPWSREKRIVGFVRGRRRTVRASVLRAGRRTDNEDRS